MVNRDTIAGRIWARLNYSEYSNAMNKVKPMLRDKKYVKQIFEAVQALDETEDKKRDLFIACVYQAYCPESYVDSNVAKLPWGIRDEISTCLGFSSAELVNHFREQMSPAMKPFNNGPDRPFRTKVLEIVEQFRKYSIIVDDYQGKLELV